MKKLVTFRLDATLLERARQLAQAENRTLTNFVETVLKRACDPGDSGARAAGGDRSAAAQTLHPLTPADQETVN